MKRLILLAAMVLPLGILSAGQHPKVGTITGTIWDEAGNPVEGATAYALNLGGMSGIMPQGLTDEAGHFTIRRLSFGRYYVSAAKEEAGYPPLHDAFYAGFGPPLPEVVLDAGRPSETVSLVLGKQAGWFAGSVRDEASGELLESCSKFRWKADPRALLGGGGLVSANFRVLVPSDTPATLKVWEWGYEPWFYRSANNSDAVSLSPGQELRVEVRLKRSQPVRQPTEQELEMKKSIEMFGCSTSEPPDN